MKCSQCKFKKICVNPKKICGNLKKETSLLPWNSSNGLKLLLQVKALAIKRLTGLIEKCTRLVNQWLGAVDGELQSL